MAGEIFIADKFTLDSVKQDTSSILNSGYLVKNVPFNPPSELISKLSMTSAVESIFIYKGYMFCQISSNFFIYKGDKLIVSENTEQLVSNSYTNLIKPVVTPDGNKVVILIRGASSPYNIRLAYLNIIDDTWIVKDTVTPPSGANISSYVDAVIPGVGLFYTAMGSPYRLRRIPLDDNMVLSTSISSICDGTTYSNYICSIVEYGDYYYIHSKKTTSSIVKVLKTDLITYLTDGTLGVTMYNVNATNLNSTFITGGFDSNTQRMSIINNILTFHNSSEVYFIDLDTNIVTQASFNGRYKISSYIDFMGDITYNGKKYGIKAELTGQWESLGEAPNAIYVFGVINYETKKIYTYSSHIDSEYTRIGSTAYAFPPPCGVFTDNNGNVFLRLFRDGTNRGIYNIVDITGLLNKVVSM